MDEIGMLIPVLVALIGLYGLYWARKEEVVQPEGGARDEAAATGDEATEIEPPGIEDGAIPLNLEKAPEGVS